MNTNSNFRLISQFIELHQLISMGDKILVAVSGGADSLFLAYALKNLGYEISMAHVNFQLRGQESWEDEKCVKHYAEEWNIPLFIQRFDTQEIVKKEKSSIQVVARNLRYDFFEEIMEKESYALCATAHHADDNSENLLMHLFSGNNAKVFSAIPEKRGKYIRPLLCLSKKEIMQECENIPIKYQTDSSNFKNDYTRNNLRNRVFPILTEMYPSLATQLGKRKDWYELQYSFIEKSLSIFAEENKNNLDWTNFEKIYEKEFLPLLIVYFLEKKGFHGYDIWNICKLVDSEVGKFIVTNKGNVHRTRNGIEILENSTNCNKLIIRQEELLTSSKEVTFGGRNIHFSFVEKSKVIFGIKNEFYLDAQKICFPLILRSWELGDKMKPFGMKNSKKMSDIFVDEKFSPAQKKAAILIEDATEIICLSDFRIAEKVRLEKESVYFLQILIYEEQIH